MMRTTGTLALADQSLLAHQAYVAGKWVDADDGSTFAVTDPATGEVLADVPDMTASETRRAIEEARVALAGWRASTAKERARILRRWADAMLENAEDLALLMTAEQGKPVRESLAEIAYAASFLEWFGEEGKRIYGDVIPTYDSNQRIVVIKQPVGVTVGITPWNFPAAMITRKAAPALAAGCTMVLKPAEQTPLSALALCVLADRAGLPAGVFSIITASAENAPVVGRELTANPSVRKLSFTGSTHVGKLLMQQCSEGIKRVSLELGGNAPFIVFDDADLEASVAGTLACKFRNAGQTCVSANRIMVQSGIYDKYVSELVKSVGALRVAPGGEPGSQVGPLIDEPALEKVERHVSDAVAKGGQVLLGGSRHPLGGTFFEPTVIVGVPDSSLACNEETFGPVAFISRFETEEEAMNRANDTQVGLAAYFYSRDISRGWRLAEGIEAGIIGINTPIISTELAPFGGVKQSGIGREGSKYGIEEWVEIKYLNYGNIGDL
jgi:succinate-semialdehyde dehydrogenase/glutarate-semialdehyde dehydrogenase